MNFAPNKKISKVIWIILAALAVAIKVFSFFPEQVEQYYTYGFYNFFSKILRGITGWLPLSLGDVFYTTVIVFVIYFFVKFIKNYKQYLHLQFIKSFLLRVLLIALIIYVVFYSFWGLNYSRTGISGQLMLEEKEYTARDLDTLVSLLHKQLNTKASMLTTAMRDSFDTKKQLFSGAIEAYRHAEKKYPFLQYSPKSIKPSLFSYIGNYLGFQGYYNPFSGEAQVNTTIPQCVEPFVTCHEVAHQLGYAKESEANFVGFLACRMHSSVNFQYSVYFDMYHYSIGELYLRDSMLVKHYDSTLHVQVKKDIATYRAFYKKYRNPIEPLITWAYSRFLTANNQPQGQRSYNEVVTWLIAYYKKYGKGAI